MIRNAVDHGIEMPERRRASGKPIQATVTLSAEQQGDRILIELADDGQGIDLERVRRRAAEAGLASEAVLAEMADEEVCRLIFAPGFSTAEKVTETSGRGVGMDVVDRAVTRLGGSISITTVAGQGTKFVMDLPLSAAIQSTVVVEQGRQIFAIPERFVHEIVGYDKIEERVRTATGAPLPVVGLGDLLRFPESQTANGERLVVVLALGRRRLGLGVDRVVARRDIYVKESHPGIASIPGIGGVSTLGDGRVVLILDPDGLMRLAYSGPSIAT
jgi:chemotaxis protein histidine kinase CheA